MKNRSRNSVSATSPEKLSSAVAELQQEVRVLRDAIDDFRMEIEYLNRNGIRLRPPEDGQPPGVLRRMAADVTSEQWPERLQVRGPAAIAPTPSEIHPAAAKGEAASPPSSGRLF